MTSGIHLHLNDTKLFTVTVMVSIGLEVEKFELWDKLFYPLKH